MTTKELTAEQDARANELSFARDIFDRRIWEYDVVSGAQIKIVLGENVFLEDATAIQFTLTQSKKPIYGYHSQYYDAVAPGVVIVHGRLWVNFIHQGYLRTLVKLAKTSGSVDAFKQLREQAELKDLDELLLRGQQNTPKTEEDIVEFVKKENQRRSEIFASPELHQGEWRAKSRPDVGRAINIQIHYGDRSLARGVPLKVIYDVNFMAEGQDIQISGQPQQEWYEFLAKRVT